MFEFAGLPPEINSARMYAGPGSGPLLAAASAWDSLALQLELAAVGYSEALTALHGPSWSGPAATAMAAAATPYIAWVTKTAVQAERAANQARMAAAAYEAAFAATVPPAVVAANRSLLLTLIATNFFGQNLPAIAATEAAYGEMWAQDTAAMFGYAEAAAPAASLETFEEPPPTTNPTTGLPNSAAASPAPSPATAPPPNPWLDAYTDVIALHQYYNAYTRFTQIPIQIELTSGSWGTLLFKLADAAVPHKVAAIMPAAGLGAAASSGVHSAVHARTGTALPLGKLSVPQSWSAAIPADSPAVRLASTSMPTGPAAAGSNPHMMVPPVGAGSQQRAKGTPVLRTLDRRFRMPRPASAG